MMGGMPRTGPGLEPSPTDADARDREAAVAALSTMALELMWALRQEAMRVCEPFGLRPTRVLMLDLVSRGIDRPGALADVLDTVPPAVTAMLNELTAKGLLARETDPEDRRRAKLALTAAGREVLAEVHARWHALSLERLQALGTSELLAVQRAFRSLVAAGSP